MKPLRKHQRIVSQLQSVPSLVPVHRIESAGNHTESSQFDFVNVILQLLEIDIGTFRWNVPSVQPAMHDDVLYMVFFCHVQKRQKMTDVAVNAAIRQQPHNMERMTGPLRRVAHCFYQSLVLKERSVLDCPGNPRQILIDDISGTDIGVTHFGIANLSLRQPNRLPAGIQRDEGVLVKQCVQMRRVRGSNGVAMRFLANSETIQNQQHCRSVFHEITSCPL